MMSSWVNRQAKGRIIWKASDAWLCVLALVALALGTDGWLRIGARISPAFGRWLGTLFATGTRMVFQCVLWLLIAFFFARVRSLRDFLNGAGLTRRPSLFGWFTAWVAIGIGFLSIYGSTRGWSPPPQIARSFYHAAIASRWFYIIRLVAIVPVYEETVMRGFIYRAFRGTYTPFVSTVLVLCVGVFFHWGLVSDSLYAFAYLSLIAISLCVIRERTDSLWNCILFHAAYNATVSVRWPIYAIGMLLLLPFCAREYARQWPSSSKGSTLDS